MIQRKNKNNEKWKTFKRTKCNFKDENIISKIKISLNEITADWTHQKNRLVDLKTQNQQLYNIKKKKARQNVQSLYGLWNYIK